MEANLYNNLNFSGYKNSKYFYSDTKNSILDSKTTSSDIPNTLDLSNIKSIYDYSNKQIKGLYKYYIGTNACYAENYASKIINKLNKGGTEASYTEMLLELVRDKKISPFVLDDITGQLNSNAARDIDKLYNAYANGEDTIKTFVPDFEDEIEASKTLETGDVCHIGNSKNISIKMQDGTIKELFITPETYLELFPPVERFICTQSGRLGDCYLLSSIDSINQNPNTRYKLLEMFRENKNSTVDIAFGGFEYKGGEIVQSHPNKTIVKDISKEILKVKDDKITSFTTEGVRAIEILYEKMKRDEAQDAIKEKYNYFKELKNDIKKGNRISLDKENIFWTFFDEREVEEKQKKLEQIKSIIIPSVSDWKTITEEELEYFCSFYENGEEMFNIGDRWPYFNITKDEVKEKLTAVQNKNDDFSRYETLVLKRILDSIGESANNLYFCDEVLPKRMMLDLFNDITKFDLLYSTSGFEKDAMENLGFIDTFKEPSNSDFVKNKLYAPDISKYVFTCSTRQDGINAQIPLYSNHAYSLSPIDTKDGRKFTVRDPHNTLNEVTLSYQELCKYFDTVDGGILP